MARQETYCSSYESAKANIEHAETIFVGQRNWNGPLEELLTYPKLRSLAFDASALPWLETGLPVLQKMNGLKELSLYLARGNDKPILPAVFELPQLETLAISNFNGRELPAGVLNLPKLKGVRLDDMDHAVAGQMMDRLLEMPHLEEITLMFQRESDHKAAPDNLLRSIGIFQHLKALKVGYGVGLPAEIGECRELESLEMWNIHHSKNEGAARQLPAEWMNCTALKKLWVRENGIASLPENMGDLKALETLFLTNNQLTQLPDSICQLKNLRQLWLEHNQIAELPTDIGALTALEDLKLSNNALTALPDSFAQLKNLKSFFYLNDNPFAEFPKPLTQLGQIGYLGINKTKIASIPASIANMKSLYTLEMKNSKLDHFPMEFLDMPSIYTLTLSGSPFAKTAEGKLILKNIKALLPYDHDETTLPQKHVLLDLILGKFDKVKAENSIDDLLDLLDFGNKVTQNNVLQILEDLQPNPFAEVKKIEKVLACGKLNAFTKASLKKALKEADLKGVTKVEGEPDIMVVGQMPGEVFKAGRKKGIPFVTGAQFNVWLQKGESGFLRDAGEADTAILDNFVALFRSADPDTKKLALELAQSGGLPAELISEALVISQIDPDADNRAAAQALFQKYASSSFQTHFSNNKRNAKAMAGKKLEGYLEKLAAHPDANLRGMAGQAFRYKPDTIGLYLQHASIAQLRALIHKNGMLYIGDLGLTAIPENVFELRELKGISAHNNKLTTVSDKIAQLTALETLIIDNNPFVSVPESILQCTSLRELQLNKCKLKTLPESIGKLSQLQVFEAKDNKLSALPESFAQLQQLQELRLFGNAFALLPTEVFALPKLQDIDLGYCKIKSIPDLQPKSGKMKELSLIGNQLSELPDFFAGLHIAQLSLARNRFKRVPEAVAAIQGLQTLALEDNPLVRLPEAMAQLKQLVQISISHPKGAEGKVDWRQIADVLATLPALKKVAMWNHDLSEADLPYLQAKLPHINF